MSSFALKIIALLLMTIDHIYYFFPRNPIWFTWLGRLSAPIFIFTLIEGYIHTSNRPKMMTRLYTYSLIMGIVNIILSVVLKKSLLNNNIFSTLFLIILNIYLIEHIYKKFKVSKCIIPSIIIIIELLLPFYIYNSPMLRAFLPTPQLTEGSFRFVFIGITLYFMRSNKFLQALSYIVFSMSYFPFENISLSPFDRYQWMMVFAVAFLYLYNGKKGRSIKYFFYLYYPLHIYLLYFLA